MPHVLGSGKSYIPSALNTLCLRYLRYLTQPEAEEEAEAEAEAEAETEAAGGRDRGRRQEARSIAG